MNPSLFHFNGLDTEFSLEKCLACLVLILLYALVTCWVYILFFRLLRPLLDALGRVLLPLNGLFSLILLAAGFYLWNLGGAGPGLTILGGALIILASLLGFAHSLVLTPLVMLFGLSCFAVLWYPFGAYTGIGWMGLLVYTFFCFKLFRLYL
jgi:hypothetical protein